MVEKPKYYHAVTLASMRENNSARRHLEAFLMEYPESKFAQTARSRLERLP